MNFLERGLARISSTIDQTGVPWSLVGGFAVSARVIPRFTRDIDVSVAVADDRAAEQLLVRLGASGYQVAATVEQDTIGRLAIARLTDSHEREEDLVVDLLFASSGIEPEIATAAERLEVVPGLVLPVARIGHLIALKLLARDDDTRPQDRGDLFALRDEATTEDFTLAEQAVALIVDRGYARGRDLRAALADLQKG